MENASKALIIAGAILLAILLISLGIMIYNQAQNTVNNSGMSQAEIEAFNTKFMKYEGIQKGTIVKALVDEVMISNAADDKPDITVILNTLYLNNITIVGENFNSSIKIAAGHELPEIGAIIPPQGTSGIYRDSIYEVQITKFARSGFVEEITITEKSN